MHEINVSVSREVISTTLGVLKNESRLAGIKFQRFLHDWRSITMFTKPYLATTCRVLWVQSISSFYIL